MPTMTFRFTTECELTLDGDSYETIYLRFKDFMHGVSDVQKKAQVVVYPPESEQMFFQLDNETEFREIPYFKGGFSDDIARYCDGRSLRPATMQSPRMLAKNIHAYPEYYW